MDTEYHQKLEDNKRLAEEATAKKRAKRLKKKQGRKQKKQAKTTKNDKAFVNERYDEEDSSDEDEESKDAETSEVNEDDKDIVQNYPRNIFVHKAETKEAIEKESGLVNKSQQEDITDVCLEISRTDGKNGT